MGVQIVEANDAAVRVAELRLRRRDTALQFVLYPMLHVGSPEFYRDVTRRLAAADVIVIEGVGPGRTASRLTSGYRAMARDAQLNLMVQYIDLNALPGQVICPDSSAEEFESRWRTVPWWQRAATMATVTSLATAQRLLGSRWLEDLDERDQRLISALSELHERRSGESITVAVVYGARHMRAVVRELARQYGYRVRSAGWLTVTTFG